MIFENNEELAFNIAITLIFIGGISLGFLACKLKYAKIIREFKSHKQENES